MYPNKGGRFVHQQTGYFRRRNQFGNFLDIDGSIVPFGHPLYLLLYINMALRPINAERYFSEVWPNESLVLRFLYRPQMARFDFVFDYAAPTVSEAFKIWPTLPRSAPLRDARWVRFDGVTSFSSSHDFLSTDLASRRYEERLLSMHSVILGVEATKCKDAFCCEIWISTFGSHKIYFQSAFADRKLMYAECSGGTWVYYDIESRLPIDFFNPFPEIDDKTTW